MEFEEKKKQDDYGADYLVNIYGTEKDRVNCPFYFKIGACRHGETCTRLHNHPTKSQTILIPHMYQNPKNISILDPNGKPFLFDEKQLRQHFEDFMEDVWEEFSRYGMLEEINVCDNICDHLAGNVVVKYQTEDEAQKAIEGLSGRYYGGRMMFPEFSPVVDFKEARCRQFETSECVRGGICNFMHLKNVSKGLLKYLQELKRQPFYKSSSHERGDSRSPQRDFNRHQHSSYSSSSSRHRSGHNDDGKIIISSNNSNNNNSSTSRNSDYYHHTGHNYSRSSRSSSPSSRSQTRHRSHRYNDNDDHRNTAEDSVVSSSHDYSRRGHNNDVAGVDRESEKRRSKRDREDISGDDKNDEFSDKISKSKISDGLPRSSSSSDRAHAITSTSSSSSSTDNNNNNNNNSRIPSSTNTPKKKRKSLREEEEEATIKSDDFDDIFKF